MRRVAFMFLCFLFLLAMSLPALAADAQNDPEHNEEKMTIEIIEGEEVEFLDPDWVVIGYDEYQAAKEKTQQAGVNLEKQTHHWIVATVAVTILAAFAAVILIVRKRKVSRRKDRSA